MLIMLAKMKKNYAIKTFWIMERKRSSWFCRIFTVAFLLLLAPARGFNPTGQSLTFTQSNLSKAPVKIRRIPLFRFLYMILDCFIFQHCVYNPNHGKIPSGGRDQFLKAKLFYNQSQSVRPSVRPSVTDGQLFSLIQAC